MAKHWVFSYGSLLNDAWIKSENRTVPVLLKGWVRDWNHAVPGFDFPVLSLSIRRRANTDISGLLIEVSDTEISALDERELGYRKLVVGPVSVLRNLRMPNIKDRKIITYVGTENAVAEGSGVILQTYLDYVIHGYLYHFGESGVLDFMESTDGWENEIHNDRNRPLYPRAKEFDSSFLDWVDAIVSRYRP
jgi:hypothetical protein